MIANLALLTGQIGKEGAGIFALTEHNNLQGVCDMGALPDRLPGYREVTSDAGRTEVEQVWRAKLPAQAGLASPSLFEQIIEPLPGTTPARQQMTEVAQALATPFTSLHLERRERDLIWCSFDAQSDHEK